VKALLPHGAFIDWLEAEFGWHRATANRFIQVAQQFGDKDLSQITTFDPSALYLLASPSTLESVREEAVERASAGEGITHFWTSTLALPTPKAAETDVPFDRVQLTAAICDVRCANILTGRNQVLDTHRNQVTEGDLRTIVRHNQMCKITSLNRYE
jgi:hypothetical protein